MLFISLIRSKKTFSLLIQTSKKIDITSINSSHLIQELKIKKIFLCIIQIHLP